jgi:hypothetical protein
MKLPTIVKTEILPDIKKEPEEKKVEKIEDKKPEGLRGKGLKIGKKEE